MSGLEVETHVIVEMAVIVTDEELNIVAEVSWISFLKQQVW